MRGFLYLFGRQIPDNGIIIPKIIPNSQTGNKVRRLVLHVLTVHVFYRLEGGLRRIERARWGCFISYGLFTLTHQQDSMFRKLRQRLGGGTRLTNAVFKDYEIRSLALTRGVTMNSTSDTDETNIARPKQKLNSVPRHWRNLLILYLEYILGMLYLDMMFQIRTSE